MQEWCLWKARPRKGEEFMMMPKAACSPSPLGSLLPDIEPLCASAHRLKGSM